MTKPRIIVAVDTSCDMLCCGVAKVEQEHYEMLSAKDHSCRRRANTELVNTVDEALKEANLTIEDVDGVLVGRGPGSFTGVRIGIATAKGIAVGANVGLYAASTLDADAFSAWESGVRGKLVVIADAMRGEVYPGLYELSDEGIKRLFDTEIVLKADAAIEMLLDKYSVDEIYLSGDGLKKYKAKFEEAGFFNFADEDAWWPKAEGMIYAFTHASMNNNAGTGDPALVLPVYTRLSDAEEDERKRLGLQEPSTTEATGCADELANIHLQLRPMSVNDISQIASLEQKAFEGSNHKCWSEKMFYEEFSAPGRVWWVAHDMGRIVGFAGGLMAQDTCEVLDVAVDPERRREGIAMRLLMRVAYDAQMLSATTITLEVDSSNSPAIKLYSTMGFEEVGKRPNYYGQGNDALIMTANLPLNADIKKIGERPEPRASKRVWPYELSERSAEQIEAIRSQGALILAIESSCDETAMSVVNESGEILSSVVATQIDFHARFGGVVPEIASRKHTEALVGVYEETMQKAGEALGLDTLVASDLTCVGVTQGPGLVGALVVGVAFAKGVCCAANLPLIGVNHLEGHLFANLFETPDLQPPFVASLVSGGNTMLIHVRDWGDYQILGATIDDAVGEAFDKVAKALGLGYPGGPVISKLAAKGNPKAIRFPRAMMHSHDYRFSLSGLKTSVITYIQKENKAGRPINIYDLAASFEAAVIDVQVAKAATAVKETGVSDFCAGGGVTANPTLRAAYKKKFDPWGVRVTVPPMGVCTDNAAMIALVALRKYKANEFAELDMDANPNLALTCKDE